MLHLPLITVSDVKADEDDLLTKMVAKHGARNWSSLARGITGRSGKSCRLRWLNQLSPQAGR